VGRPRFAPTDEQRNNVTLLIGFGLTEAEICQLIKNPSTSKPIDEKTLRRHFSAEIAAGGPSIKAQVGNKILATILGREGGLTDEKSIATLMIFYAKTRMGWKETVVNEHANSGGQPFIFQVNKVDAKL
jgi:hypothetical protein